MATKGIILAGGSGTRLYPITSIFSKQLQVIYDKPMIFYPLSTLMLAGVKDILLISTPNDTPNFERLLGDGSQWGLNISYVIQNKPGGIAEAFLYGKDFIGRDEVCLILGDNVFYGKMNFLLEALTNNPGGTIFGYRVQNPQAYGVVEFGKNFEVMSLVEKPKNPRSNFAIPGLYIFDSDVVEITKNLKPSGRGELEIIDVQREYLCQGRLRVKLMGRGIAWLDTGTPETMLEAGIFISAIEKRQGMKIACLEEIALAKGFITKEDYFRNVNSLPNCSYRDYCLRIAEEY